MEKAIKYPITFNMPKFNGKVTLEDIKGRMGFVFHNSKDMCDVVLDMDFDMHIKDYYENMIKGVHVMLEWYNGCDIALTSHLIDDILNSETMEEELYEGYLKAKEILLSNEEYERQMQEMYEQMAEDYEED